MNKNLWLKIKEKINRKSIYKWINRMLILISSISTCSVVVVTQLKNNVHQIKQIFKKEASTLVYDNNEIIKYTRERIAELNEKCRLDPSEENKANCEFYRRYLSELLNNMVDKYTNDLPEGD